MIGFNHGLVGGLIGKFIPWPLGIPLALASHFALDTLPHYGIPPKKRDKSLFWKLFFTLDFFATLSLAVWAIAHHHYAMYVCGQIAVLPDFVWVAHVVRKHTFDFSGAKNRFERWHIKIQHHEFAGGIWIELPLAAVLFYFCILQTP